MQRRAFFALPVALPLLPGLDLLALAGSGPGPTAGVKVAAGQDRFGQSFTYPLARFVELTGSANPLALREFIGNTEMGFKVAWSDRMVSLYTSFWAGGLVFAGMRRRIQPLALIPFLLLLAPLAIDGLTHTVSDIQGFGAGFRDTNIWLSALTNATLLPAFYAGDAWGSFNSIMRLASGVAAGWGVAWLVFPRLEMALEPSSAVQAAQSVGRS